MNTVRIGYLPGPIGDPWPGIIGVSILLTFASWFIIVVVGLPWIIAGPWWGKIGPPTLLTLAPCDITVEVGLPGIIGPPYPGFKIKLNFAVSVLEFKIICGIMI